MAFPYKRSHNLDRPNLRKAASFIVTNVTSKCSSDDGLSESKICARSFKFKIPYCKQFKKPGQILALSTSSYELCRLIPWKLLGALSKDQKTHYQIFLCRAFKVASSVASADAPCNTHMAVATW